MQELSLTILKAAVNMNPADLKVLVFLGTLGPLTPARLTEALDVNPSYLSQRLAILLERGLIQKTQVTLRPGAPIVRSGYQIAVNIEANLALLAEAFDTSVIDAMVAI